MCLPITSSICTSGGFDVIAGDGCDDDTGPYDAASRSGITEGVSRSSIFNHRIAVGLLETIGTVHYLRIHLMMKVVVVMLHHSIMEMKVCLQYNIHQRDILLIC